MSAARSSSKSHSRPANLMAFCTSYMAAAELDRTFTVWMRDPNRVEGEDYDALLARLKAEIVGKLAA